MFFSTYFMYVKFKICSQTFFFVQAECIAATASAALAASTGTTTTDDVVDTTVGIQTNPMTELAGDVLKTTTASSATFSATAVSSLAAAAAIKDPSGGENLIASNIIITSFSSFSSSSSPCSDTAATITVATTANEASFPDGDESTNGVKVTKKIMSPEENSAKVCVL